MQISRIFMISFCVACLIFTSGCTRRISPNTYHSASVGEASQAFRGYVVSVRKVTVQEAERFQDNALGMGVGAVAGGLLGSQIGGGTSSHVVGGVLGALAGGAAGAFVQDQLGSQEGLEYTVQLDNGRIMTVVQGLDETYAVGQRVMVIVSQQGRSRVVPDNASQPAPQVVYQQVLGGGAHPQMVQAQVVPPQTVRPQVVQQPVMAVQQPVVYAALPASQLQPSAQQSYDVPQPQIVYYKNV